MHRQNGSIILFIVSGVVLTIVSAFLLLVLPNILAPATRLFLGDGIFNASVISNEDGLSGISKLASDQAILMVYPSEAKWSVSIKDMPAPVDIIWLDVNKKIVHVVLNASSDGSKSRVFKPNSLAKYVIEVPAETVADKAVKLGRAAIFQINEQRL
jgi:uncharacterized membrane protein (UPF0127 family)